MGKIWIAIVLLAIILIYRIYKRRIRGILGEKTVSGILSFLPKSKYRIINNLVLDVNGKTSQVDHVVISSFGLFVIETKNVKGWILGGENSEYWTQVFYKQRRSLYNPIWQNRGHVRLLKHHLSDYPQIKYFPIVVFSSKATIKVDTSSEIIRPIKLLRVIRRHSQIVLSPDEREIIYSKLCSLNLSATYSRSDHISAIKRRAGDREKVLKQNKCPRCGGHLVLRKGKFGKFKGCENYPRCRLTVNY